MIDSPILRSPAVIASTRDRSSFGQ